MPKLYKVSFLVGQFHCTLTMWGKNEKIVISSYIKHDSNKVNYLDFKI